MYRKSTLSIIRVFPKLILFILILVSCENTNSTITKTIDSNAESIGKIQFEQKCIACHGFENKTEEEMIAPPMYAVKRRYMKASKNKDEFINLMSNWVKNPQQEKVLMRDAAIEKGVMPHLNYDEKDIMQIVNYLYETEMTKPEWFDAHQQSHQK